MESSARRRLDSISRHFLKTNETTYLLQSVVLNSGQLKHGEAEPVVIGGMVLDIHATPSIPANPRTTTPGKVNYVLGGVARNVAECMSKLGTKPFMISALGLDMPGNLLLEHWKSAGLSTDGIRKQKDIETAVVSNILDVNGELAAAVASVEAIRDEKIDCLFRDTETEKFLTPDWIQQFECNISSAPLFMVDANLNLPALEASCQMAAAFKIPVWFEPVSVEKSKRIVSVAKYVYFASPNEDELIAMANALHGGNVYSFVERENRRNKLSIESLFKILKPAIWLLLESGIKIVAVTLGSDGVFLCSKGGPSFMRTGCEGTKQYAFSGQLYKLVTIACPSSWFSSVIKSGRSSHLFVIHFPAIPASVVRLTGAGDCLVGGTLASICAGLDIMQSVAVGIAASKAAVEVETNVPRSLSLAAIADDARLVYSAAKVVCDESML